MGLFRRLKRNPFALLGGAIVAVLLVSALAAPYIAPHDPLQQDLPKQFLPPGTPGYPLGTDDLGRCILSRILFGARFSLLIGVGVVGIALSVGVPLGAISGYFAHLDRPIMMIIDILLAFPRILLALVIVSTLGVGFDNIIIAVAVYSIPIYVRIVRGVVLSLKQMDFVLAARASGEKDYGLLFVHILPNCIGPIIVQSTINVGTGILIATSLSFLGLAPPDLPEWGAMLSAGRLYMNVAPHLLLFPGLSIMLTVLGFNLLGDGLRDALDPRLRE